MATRMMKALGMTVATTAVAMTAIAMAGAAAVDTVRTAPVVDGIQLAQAVPQATLMSEGGPLYARDCAPCHGMTGGGGDGPKLVGNPKVEAKSTVVNQITVGGQYMPPIGEGFNNRQVAAVGTFIRNSWGNAFGPISLEEVTQIRGK